VVISYGQAAVLRHLGQTLPLSQWTELRNDLISNDALGQRGLELGVGDLIITQEGTPVVSSKMIACTFAAIIGAVQQDAGVDAAVTVMRHLGLFNHPYLMVTLQSIFCIP